MPVAVRCPDCQQLSRVPDSAIGYDVACPNCRCEFEAVPEHLDVPVVYPAKIPAGDPEFDGFPGEAEERGGPKNVLFGLALLPFVIPLLWILGPTLTGKEAIFTFTLPMAIAISSTGLCLGIVLAADWTFATRVKGILAIVVVMHFGAGLLYFMKTEWVEAIRKFVGRGNEDRWVKFEPPDRAFSAKVPSRMREDDGALLADWKLKAFRTDAPDDPATYTVAHGRHPAELKLKPDEEFFAAAKEKATEASGGTIIAEKEARLPGFPGREYVFQMADRNTRRIVRVYRIEPFVLVAAVEGAFLTADASDVKTFFDHIKWKPGK